MKTTAYPGLKKTVSHNWIKKFNTHKKWGYAYFWKKGQNITVQSGKHASTHMKRAIVRFT